jgi:hypothetical protein
MSSHPAETATLYRSMLATCQVATEHFSDLLDDLHATPYYDTTPNGRACRHEAVYLSRETEKRLLTSPKVLQDTIPEGILTESFGDGSTAGIPCMLVDTESIETEKAESIKYYGGIDGVLQWYNEYSGGIGAAGGIDKGSQLNVAGEGEGCAQHRARVSFAERHATRIAVYV